MLSDGEFELRRFCNAIVDLHSDGRVVERQQEMREVILSFEDYRAFLERVIIESEQTFGSSGRLVPLSTGYDSVCCAALAKRLGGAVSYSMVRDRNGLDDDGAAIGKILDLDVHQFARVARQYSEKAVQYKGPGGVEREEIIAFEEASELVDCYAGMGFADECMRIPDQLLEGRAVLTGFHGDKVWSLRRADSDMVRGDVSGSSLIELHLRTGFMHIPIPMMGSQAHEQIRTIATSDELKPWRIGGRYDRPIPRRIAEEEGVPRELFGQEKRAIATRAANREDIAPRVLELQIARYAEASRRSSWSAQ